MYARSRSKSPMTKKRRSSKSPSRRGKYAVTGRGEYGFQQMFTDLAGDLSQIPLVGEAAKISESNASIAEQAYKDYKGGGSSKYFGDEHPVNAWSYVSRNAITPNRSKAITTSSNRNLSSASDASVKPLVVSGISGVSGRGAYIPQLILGGDANQNSLIRGGRSPLQFGGMRDENGSLIISYSEFVRDVSAPTGAGFSVTGYGLNPGQAESFPLLSQFAQNFEEYEFQQLIIEFRSAIDASSVVNSTGNVGSVLLCTNYNADADLFLDKEQMLLYSGGVEGRITENVYHGLECDRSKLSGSSTKFVRASNLPVGDYKDYDKGVFQIGFSNLPTTFQGVQVGALYAHYTVRLSKPKLWSALANNVQATRYYSTTGLAYNNLIGTQLCSALKSTIKGLAVTHETISTSHGLRFTFPDYLTGIYDIYVSLEANISSVVTGLVGGTYSAQVNTAAGATISLYADQGVGLPVSVASPTSNVYALTPGFAMVKIRVRMTPCVIKGSNWASFVLLGAASVNIIAVYSEVQEIGTNFATRSDTPFPQWVNKDGAIIVSP